MVILYHLSSLDILSSKPFPSVIPEFVAYLTQDNALNDLCGKTLGIPSKKKVIAYGGLCFKRHFDGDD